MVGELVLVGQRLMSRLSDTEVSSFISNLRYCRDIHPSPVARCFGGGASELGDGSGEFVTVGLAGEELVD